MRILHTFYVIIFLINLTWAVSVVALAPQPRRLAVRLGGEELVWGSSVFAVIPGASGNQFYNPHIIYSVSPFKSQLLKLFGASWKLLWKLSLANNFSVVIQPYLLFILDTWTDWNKHLFFVLAHLRLLSTLFPRFFAHWTVDFRENLQRLSPKTSLHNISALIKLNSANFCVMIVFAYNKTYFNEIPISK